MTKPTDPKLPRPEIEYRGVTIRTFEVPCTPFVWIHDELDGHGSAPTLDQAQAQIDRHLELVARAEAEGA